MGIICDTCGRDIDALGQDNMSVDAPLCEDCRGEQQGHAAAVLKRENASLSGEVRKLRFENARLREIWHHLPKGGDRCRWCGHLFEDFTYRKVGPSAKEGAQRRTGSTFSARPSGPSTRRWSSTRGPSSSPCMRRAA